MLFDSIYRLENNQDYTFKDRPQIFDKPAVRFLGLLDSTDPRNNTITSLQLSSDGFPDSSVAYTESEGIQGLYRFLQRIHQIAKKYNNTEMQIIVEAFTENIFFLGSGEFIEGCNSIAHRIQSLLDDGKKVDIFVAGNRSEKYVTLHVLESLMAAMSTDSPFKKNLSMVFDANLLSADSEVVILDDFIVSGARMNTNVQQAYRSMYRQGFRSEDPFDHIHAMVIASRVDDREGITNPEDSSFSITDNDGACHYYNIYSRFGVSDYRDSRGKLCVFPGVSMSGFHCSVDYGFSKTLYGFVSYAQDHGERIPFLPFVDIQKEYEPSSESPHCFSDTALQQRWENVCEYFS